MVRIKNRWLLLSVSSSPQGQVQSQSIAESTDDSLRLEPHPTLDAGSLTRVIRTALALNFGDTGAGALGGLICKYYARNTGTAILRCSREGLQVVRAAIFMIDEALGRKTRILVEHCGGTIKKVQQKAMQLDRRKINLMFRKKKLVAKQAPQKSDSVSGVPTPSTSALDILGSEDLGTSLDPDGQPETERIGVRRKRSEGTEVFESKRQKLDEEEKKLVEENNAGIMGINP